MTALNGPTTDWLAVAEAIKAIAPIFTAAAACTGAWIAWKGLEKWRQETSGKRRADVATDVLALVYQMEDVLREARGPFVLSQEMTKKEGVPDEYAADAAYAPERRLLEHEEFFGLFRVQKHAYASVFGRTAAVPYDDLWKIRLEINWAVFDMLQHKEIRNSREPADRELWLSYHCVAFRSDPDKIGDRIAADVAAIEAVCRPAIEARNK